VSKRAVYSTRPHSISNIHLTLLSLECLVTGQRACSTGELDCDDAREWNCQFSTRVFHNNDCSTGSHTGTSGGLLSVLGRTRHGTPSQKLQG
jgi:hypothetical protein